MKKVTNLSKLRAKLHKELDTQLDKILRKSTKAEAIWSLGLNHHVAVLKKDEELVEHCGYTAVIVATTTGEYVLDARDHDYRLEEA